VGGRKNREGGKDNLMQGRESCCPDTNPPQGKADYLAFTKTEKGWVGVRGTLGRIDTFIPELFPSVGITTFLKEGVDEFYSKNSRGREGGESGMLNILEFEIQKNTTGGTVYG